MSSFWVIAIFAIVFVLIVIFIYVEYFQSNWSVAQSIHESVVRRSCDRYGYGCIEKFKEEFDKVEWVRHHEYESLFSDNGIYYSNSTKCHASIISFNGIGMILNRKDWKEAGRIIREKIKSLPKSKDYDGNFNWGCK